MGVDFVRHLIEHAAFLPLKGQRLLLQGLTTAQRNLLPVPNNWIIFNITTNQFERYEAGAWGPFAVNHNLLSATHPDTLPGAVVRGDLAFGSPAPLWTRLPIGGVGNYLRSTGLDPAWSPILVGDLPAHSVTHIPGGVDALPVGIPSNIGVANAVGALNAFVRQDHIHAHPAGLGIDLHHPQIHAPTHIVGAGDPLSVGVPSNIGVANAEGALTNFVRRDHVHAHPAFGAGILANPHDHSDLAGVTAWQHHTHYNLVLYAYDLSPVPSVFGGGYPDSAVNQYFCSPVIVKTRCRIDQIGLTLRERNSGNIILAVHDSNAAGLPNSLLCQTNALGVAANWNVDDWNHFVSTTTPTVDPGIYWVGWICDTGFAAGVAGCSTWSARHAHGSNDVLWNTLFAGVYEQNVGAFNPPNPMVEAVLYWYNIMGVSLKVTVL